MRNKILLVLLSVAAVFTYVSCSDEEQDANIITSVTDRSQNYTMAYTADGKFYKKTTTETVTASGITSTKVEEETDTPLNAATNPVTVDWEESSLQNQTKYSIKFGQARREEKTTETGKNPETKVIVVPDTVAGESNFARSFYKYASTYYVGQTNYDEDGVQYSKDIPVTVSTGFSAALPTISWEWSDSVVYYQWSDGGTKRSPKAPALTDTLTSYKKITTERTEQFTLTKITQ